MSKISWHRLLGYTYFSSGKLKFLLNFNTHSKKCFTQQQALCRIICRACGNEHLPGLILIWACAADMLPARSASGAHLPPGGNQFFLSCEKRHLLKILQHATLAWDLDASLENNSRLCGSLSPSGQHASCSQWQGAIRWRIPQTGPSPATLNRSHLRQELAAHFLSSVRSFPHPKLQHPHENYFMLVRFLLRKWK